MTCINIQIDDEAIEGENQIQTKYEKTFVNPLLQNHATNVVQSCKKCNFFGWHLFRNRLQLKLVNQRKSTK